VDSGIHAPGFRCPAASVEDPFALRVCIPPAPESHPLRAESRLVISTGKPCHELRNSDQNSAHLSESKQPTNTGKTPAIPRFVINRFGGSSPPAGLVLATFVPNSVSRIWSPRLLVRNRRVALHGGERVSFGAAFRSHVI
jgi:hypothetical protein